MRENTMLMVFANTKATSDEAFGPKVNPRSRYLYSKHNLQVKYQTWVDEKLADGTTRKKRILASAAEILAGRYQTAMKFGYDPSAGKLAPKDKEQLRTVDYVDALIMSQLQRLLEASALESIQELLAVTWTPENVVDYEKLSRSLPRMMENFKQNNKVCQVLLRSIQESGYAAKFTNAWIGSVYKTMDDMERLMGQLRESYMSYVEKKLIAVA